MKICTLCKEEKNDSEFYKHKLHKDGLCSECKLCHHNKAIKWKKDNPEKYRRNWKNYYQTNRTRILESQKISNKDNPQRRKEERRIRKQVWLDELAKRNMLQCNTCGYNKCFAALDFHHTDPSKKEITISALLLYKVDKERLKELDKVICLCSNCHREFHHSKEENRNVPK